VSDLKQLLAFGQDSSLKFRLNSDLDLGDNPNFYIPYFAGELDGNGHTISGLRLDFSCVAQVGLFGYLGYGGMVSQLGVENVNVTATREQGVGGLVGGSAGAVRKSFSTGSVTGTMDVGGLVGWNKGTVSDSYSGSAVSYAGRVGGLVGWNYGGAVSNSYSTGSVTSERNTGGLVGANTLGGTISGSFWDIEASGQASSDGGIGKSTSEMKSIATFSTVGWNVAAVASPNTRNPAFIWNIADGQTYPFLSWQSV